MEKTFDYWMLNTMDSALNELYNKTLKGPENYGKVLKHIADKEGLDKAKQVEKEWQTNQFHPLGKIHLTQLRIQEMKSEVNVENWFGHYVIRK